jgi:hypothetical protein
MNIICWLRGIWRTFLHGSNFIPISGHNFAAVDESGFTLECETCGERKRCWR